MKKFILPKPTAYEILLSEIFAEECYETVREKYVKRSQEDQDKVKLDMKYGKIAEILLRRYFTKNKIASSAPDFLIYPKEEKTFDADIYSFKLDKYNCIHVKSCMAESTYKRSWLFQPEDAVTSSPKLNDFFALTVLDIRPNFMCQSYCYLANANEVISLYRPAEKENLDKKVIYEEDLNIS